MQECNAGTSNVVAIFAAGLMLSADAKAPVQQSVPSTSDKSPLQPLG